MNEALLNAYRWKRQQNPRFSAMWSHHCAREDVAADIRRYPSEPMRVCWQSNDNPRSSERLGYVESPEKIGLRLVGRVMADCGGRNGIWDTRDDSGWFTDPNADVFKDGTGLCYGLVYQLPGRGGKARFVAGYQFGGCDGGPMIDFGTVFEGDTRDHWSGGYNPKEVDAALTAARSADSMANREAEEEREYQTAWQAGSMYAQTKEEADGHKADIRRYLASRRELKAEAARIGLHLDAPKFAPLCDMIHNAVSGCIAELQEARAKMEKLASGDHETRHCYLGFFTGEERLRAAFNEGAGETVLR
jgi:hypothetical protein